MGLRRIGYWFRQSTGRVGVRDKRRGFGGGEWGRGRGAGDA